MQARICQTIRDLTPVTFLALVISLALIGDCTIYSACCIGSNFMKMPYYIHQRYALLVGCLGLAIAWHLNPFMRRLLFGSLYILSMLLLGAVLVWGKEMADARRFIAMCGITIQPSEPARLATLVMLAEWLGRLSDGFSSWRAQWPGWLILLPPVFLIAVEPSVGVALTLLAAGSILILFRTLRPRALLAAAAIIVVSCIAYGCILHHARTNEAWKYQVALWDEFGADSGGFRGRRIISLLLPEGTTNDRNAVTAIACGGAFGTGFNEGTMKSLLYVGWAVSHTDYILSVFAEEWGWAGCFVLFCLFGVLIWMGFQAAGTARDPVLGLAAAGVMLLFTAGVIINAGMHIRVAPILGIPLPLMSYGANNAVWTLTGIGIVLSAFSSAKAQDKPPPTPETPDEAQPEPDPDPPVQLDFNVTW